MATTLALVGCSGKPSDDEAVRLFKGRSPQFKSEQRFDIDDVRRINGYENDSPYHVVELQFDLVARVSYEELVDELTKKAGGDFIAVTTLRDQMIPALDKESGRFTKGQRLTGRTKKMLLRRTESGWALAS